MGPDPISNNSVLSLLFIWDVYMVSPGSTCFVCGTGGLSIRTGVVLLQPSVMCQLGGAEQTGGGQGRHGGNQDLKMCSPVASWRKATGWETADEHRLSLGSKGFLLWCKWYASGKSAASSCKVETKDRELGLARRTQNCLNKKLRARKLLKVERWQTLSFGLWILMFPYTVCQISI